MLLVRGRRNAGTRRWRRPVKASGIRTLLRRRYARFDLAPNVGFERCAATSNGHAGCAYVATKQTCAVMSAIRITAMPQLPP